MSGCGCAETKFDGASAAYRRALITVIAINAVMFVVEMTAGIRGQSMALQADALDFLGDTATYALSLWVIGQSARMRTLALPKEVEHWSLTTLRKKLVKNGAKVVSRGRYVTFQEADGAVPRELFRETLSLIDGLRPAPLSP